jgi:hypothetical protein
VPYVGDGYLRFAAVKQTCDWQKIIVSGSGHYLAPAFNVVFLQCSVKMMIVVMVAMRKYRIDLIHCDYISVCEEAKY